VAVVLTSGSTFGSVTITADRGAGINNYGGAAGYSAAGTIFTKTPSQTYGKVKVSNSGIGLWGGGSLTPGTRIPDGETWQVDQVELVNGGGLWIDDTSTLIVSDTSLSSTNGYLINEGTLSTPGDFLVTNITFMPIAGSSFSGLTNLTVASGAYVSHVDNHTAEDWKLELTVPGDLRIDAGGQINVDGKGYWRSKGPAGGGNYAMGGGHGGQGGSGRDLGQDPDPTYGSITCPTNIGSAGQRYSGPSETDGGGAAKITVGGSTTLNGPITANGKTTANNLAGAGSGGSVWLTTSTLLGSGTIRANGGVGTVSAASGGGGGRIAVYLTGSDSFGSVVMQAFGGDGPPYSGREPDGAAGTVYKQTQSQGAGRGDLIVDNDGLATSRGEHTQISSAVTGTEVGDVIIRNAGHFEVDAGQSITVYGSWSNGYAFSAGAGGTVAFAGTNEVTVYGDNMFDSLVVTGVTKQINFQAGATQDVDNVFTLEGPGAPTLLLRSASPGAQWYLNLDAGVGVSIDYVDVSDSNADHGTAVAAGNSVDSGNNDNWVFGSAGQTNIWVGPTSTGWGEVSNWTLGRAPIGDDAAVVISNGTFDPTMPSAQTFNNLEVQSGAVLSMATYGLTVNADAIVAGTIIATGTETIAVSNLTLTGTLTLAGAETVLIAGNANFTGGTFTKASSHAILNGSIAQTVTSAGQSFNTLTVSNSSALVTFADAVQVTTYDSRSADVTYGGNLTATAFYVYSDSGAVTHTFNAGSTYTMGELWLYGSAGNVQNLVSSSSSAWNLNVSSVASVSYVDVAYSDASGGIEILAQNSTDSGNNANWNFGPFSIWTGDSGTSFHTAASWSPSGVPGANTYILVDDATTLNIGSPATVRYARVGGVNATLVEVDSDFTVVGNVDVINNGTIEINNDPGMTVGTNMNVASGGMLTHADNSTTEADKMMLTVGGDLTIDAGAAIDVTGLGYNRDYGPGTPDGGVIYSGGSHGGRGGAGNGAAATRDNCGLTYGSYNAPTNIGSGSSDDSGGTGGGAAILTVGGLSTINGDIIADGGAGVNYDSGAGGSVYLTTATLAGSGTISANGGLDPNPGVHGAGGGGRVAVVLTSGSSFGSVTMTANRGAGSTFCCGTDGFDSAGTVYTKTPSQTYGTLKIDNQGVGLDNNDAARDLTPGTQIPAGETWRVDELVLVNQGTVFVPSNATLDVTGTDFSSSSTNGNIVLEAYGALAGPCSYTLSNVTLHPLQGSMLSGITNLAIDGSALVTHPRNASAEKWKLALDIPGNLTIRSGASVNGDGKGFWGGNGPAGGGNYGMGGGHGGQGGHGRDAGQVPGDAYGSIVSPTNFGSGGQRFTSPIEVDGGGAMKITVGGTTTLDGILSADGRDTTGVLNGGGAGGSVWLTTAMLTGSGTISANGGETPDSQSAGGGGGRIAVHLTGADSFGSVSFSAHGGDGGKHEGAAGTVYKQGASAAPGNSGVLVDNHGLVSTMGEKTQLPAKRDLQFFKELTDSFLVVTNGAALGVTTNAEVGNILVYADSSLTLGSNKLAVFAVEHNLEDLADGELGPTNHVDHYDQILWLGSKFTGGMQLLFK
jgi:hypothetical protein